MPTTTYFLFDDNSGSISNTTIAKVQAVEASGGSVGGQLPAGAVQSGNTLTLTTTSGNTVTLQNNAPNTSNGNTSNATDAILNTYGTTTIESSTGGTVQIGSSSTQMAGTVTPINAAGSIIQTPQSLNSAYSQNTNTNNDTTSLVVIGLLAIGGFVYYKRKK